MDLISLSCHLFSFFVPIFFLETSTMASGRFSVIGPTGPIQVSVGEVAELPCYLYPAQSAEHMEVIWFQSTRIVHLYQDGEDQFGEQDPNYQGRTELLRDSIYSGNVTLKIRDVRLLDEGTYRCYFENGFDQKEADVMLKVSGEEIKPVLVFWMILFIVYVIAVWVLTFGLFIWLLLRYQGMPWYFLGVMGLNAEGTKGHSLFLGLGVLSEHLTQTNPWLWEGNGILVISWAFEIEIALYFLWILLRCQGFSHKEESDKLDWMDWVAFLISLFLPWRMTMALLALFKRLYY
ncbi:myelin-oligodendrocyte glycoprotein isoform X1 [Sarcophilus harrisii]|uniref:Ig-like domain-containing protein n=1 Tax=Sarcophilus harrisii TaxID=9305 RepID=A0A7N4NHV5_SARHA|nr:myelin-oligodendrocyte glycoprotein isoform X1 [Sarcophilus harrisii]XP_031803308.1 myelin-oligodendrocyte glycoprotein isoform X1 [Sarcophilus harrisii]XP_031803309.1 myelin-oligodendrocyte glycoprotein isoform X1 [Sarcophilus harrisii]XP_031803310.1 myelin-oligodendrocyte glycoprotein isoform X1 [Sarcophilus harrisii]XP_031803311.1 myelin-oligodendrocyte glycoprotein isoform X1 [Sarcophilus harrisii]